jgi:hypothetical protein
MGFDAKKEFIPVFRISLCPVPSWVKSSNPGKTYQNLIDDAQKCPQDFELLERSLWLKTIWNYVNNAGRERQLQKGSLPGRRQRLGVHADASWGTPTTGGSLRQIKKGGLTPPL